MVDDIYPSAPKYVQYIIVDIIRLTTPSICCTVAGFHTHASMLLSVHGLEITRVVFWLDNQDIKTF